MNLRIKDKMPDVWVYLCMEDRNMWDKVFNSDLRF
jgi:hypothetical protein